MANVEKLLILPQNLTSQQVETVVDTYRSVIEQNGGRLEEIEMWGVKSLAYRIKKNRKAHFALLNIDAPPAAIAEMERQMQTSEDVLRFMTIRVEELESEPSATMQKRDRDDRKDRERGRPREEPSNTVETGLDLQSSLILSELRSINDDIERALSRGA